MLLHELLNENLSLIGVKQATEDNFKYAKSWLSKDEVLFVSNDNYDQFLLNLEKIYSIRGPIFTRFTRQKIYKFVEDELIKHKKNRKSFTKDVSNSFFLQFEEKKPYSKYIIAPISA